MENNETPRDVPQPSTVPVETVQPSPGLEQESTTPLVAPDTTQANVPAQAPAKNKTKLVLVIVGVVAVLGLIGGLVYAYVLAPSKTNQQASTAVVAPTSAATLTPTSAVDKAISTESTADSEAAATQSDSEEKAISNVNTDTSNVSGAYDESQF